MKKWWRIWCRTWGEKVSPCNREADVACLIRSVYAIIMFGTCFFIMANTIKHWNDGHHQTIQIQQGVPK